MSFYMTLPCDASRGAYPDNRIGKYTTILAREVVLEDEFEVGLSECVIPVPRRSLNFKQSMIIHEFRVGETKIEVDATQIASISDLDSLTIPVTKDGRQMFKLSTKDRKIVLSVARGCMVYFREENKDLAHLLGFDIGIYLGSEIDIAYRDWTASHPFGGSGTLFFIYIYCDLVAYSYVGDSMVPCLRTLPVIPGENTTSVLRFENPHYVPLASSRFSQITIEIANDHGEEIEFEKGLSLVKLHFRPKKK